MGNAVLAEPLKQQGLSRWGGGRLVWLGGLEEALPAPSEVTKDPRSI